MLPHEIISSSITPWSTPVVLVRKKDGTVLFCFDYRKLNDATEADIYPLPCLDDALDGFEDCMHFLSSTLYLAIGKSP